MTLSESSRCSRRSFLAAIVVVIDAVIIVIVATVDVDVVVVIIHNIFRWRLKKKGIFLFFLISNFSYPHRQRMKKAEQECK